MRTIKFRGKGRSDRWFYGFYSKSFGEGIITDEFGDGWIISTNTVGQFTGLTDKNGKEIYEGDVIIDETNRKGTVIFYNGCFSFITEFLSIMKVIDKISNVIGNIYDNPELSELVEQP